MFYKKLVMFAGFILGAATLFTSSAFAATPTVSATLVGGDSVQLNITGDINSNVLLNYSSVSNQVQMSSLGITNSGGSLTTTISTGSYGIAPGSLYYVSVGSQRTDTLVWPYNQTASSTTGSLSLSQTSATLSVGQSTTITAYNNNGSSLFLSSNTNPAVANVSINGNQFTISVNASGTTNVTVCSLVNSSNCSTVSVTSQSTNVSPVTFSQNNIMVGYGQDVSISIGGGTGSYTVSSNSNSSVMQASINGASLTLHALTTTGLAVITICSSDMSSCGVVSVTAGTTGTSSSGILFSQNNPAVMVGQTTVVTVSGGVGTYYISTNSNSNVAQANLVGNTLTIFGNSVGAALLTICTSGSSCSVLPVNVLAQGSSLITLGQTSVTLSAGQNSTISISGSGGYYVGSNSNQTIASATISGSNLIVSALTAGTTNISVCQTGGQCATLYLTVTGSTSNPSTASSLIPSLVLSIGQGVNLMVAGGTAPYILSSNSGTIFSANIVGSNVVSIVGKSAGTGSVTICGATGGCTSVYAIVVSSGSTSSSDSSNKYKFNNPLKLGDQGQEVAELQNRLTREGFFSGNATGYFGPLTEQAVKKYQASNGLNALGNVGPGTRAALNGD